jgi:succinate--hydroxymethylglutarate CoA-transferase
VQLVKDLAAQCDIVVENFLPGKADKMGIGYAALSAINPSIIYGSISGYGATGPLSQRAGYDLAAASHGGLLSLTGEETGPPVKVGVAVTDLATGLYLHGALLAALWARHRTGRGQHLTTSLLEAQVNDFCRKRKLNSPLCNTIQVANLANIGSNVLACGWPTKRWGTAHESIAPYQACCMDIAMKK